MKSHRVMAVCMQSLLLGLSAAVAVASPEEAMLTLAKSGKSACALVIISDGKRDSLLEQSADLIANIAKGWSGVALPSTTLKGSDRELPVDQSIVFTTLDTLKKLAPELAASHKEFAQAATMDKQGFVCVPITNKNAKQLFIVSQTPRGVYNGAVYIRDFCIDGTKQNLYADFRPVVRSPQMTGRPVYTLTIWAQESRYTAADWATVFQSFARDGVDTVYFWVSGHFPSKQFPQAYKCKDVFDGKLYDTTEETQIGTVQDLKDIVGSAHKLGLKIYLGGALGGWCGTQFLTNLEPSTLKTGPKEPSLCPSNPKCRKALVDYYQEMFAAIPEADGLFIESADEIGECKCDLCSKPVDTLGSKQFGQSQLSLCQEIMSRVWRIHPQAHFAYTIGYQEHAKDVAYYSLIQRLSNDPRFEWMESRKSWSFPGPSGEARPASFFSKKFMHWNQDANTPLETLIGNANRAKAEGMSGLVTCFSPGFDSGVFYKQIPIPTDALPHALTGFVYREATWNPDLTVDGMHDLVQKRFFGKEAPKNLSDGLWKLREIMRTKKGVEKVDAIEQHIQEAQSNAGPKTLEGLAIMTRAVNDIHNLPKKKRK
jgi:hypothetical protein